METCSFIGAVVHSCCIAAFWGTKLYSKQFWICCAIFLFSICGLDKDCVIVSLLYYAVSSVMFSFRWNTKIQVFMSDWKRATTCSFAALLKPVWNLVQRVLEVTREDLHFFPSINGSDCHSQADSQRRVSCFWPELVLLTWQWLRQELQGPWPAGSLQPPPAATFLHPAGSESASDLQ